MGCKVCLNVGFPASSGCRQKEFVEQGSLSPSLLLPRYLSVPPLSVPPTSDTSDLNTGPDTVNDVVLAPHSSPLSPSL
jgi:hypothetical protein